MLADEGCEVVLVVAVEFFGKVDGLFDDGEADAAGRFGFASLALRGEDFEVGDFISVYCFCICGEVVVPEAFLDDEGVGGDGDSGFPIEDMEGIENEHGGGKEEDCGDEGQRDENHPGVPVGRRVFDGMDGYDWRLGSRAWHHVFVDEEIPEADYGYGGHEGDDEEADDDSAEEFSAGGGEFEGDGLLRKTGMLEDGEAGAGVEGWWTMFDWADRHIIRIRY